MEDPRRRPAGAPPSRGPAGPSPVRNPGGSPMTSNASRRGPSSTTGAGGGGGGSSAGRGRARPLRGTSGTSAPPAQRGGGGPVAAPPAKSAAAGRGARSGKGLRMRPARPRVQLRKYPGLKPAISSYSKLRARATGQLVEPKKRLRFSDKVEVATWDADVDDDPGANLAAAAASSLPANSKRLFLRNVLLGAAESINDAAGGLFGQSKRELPKDLPTEFVRDAPRSKELKKAYKKEMRARGDSDYAKKEHRPRTKKDGETRERKAVAGGQTTNKGAGRGKPGDRSVLSSGAQSFGQLETKSDRAALEKNVMGTGSRSLKVEGAGGTAGGAGGELGGGKGAKLLSGSLVPRDPRTASAAAAAVAAAAAAAGAATAGAVSAGAAAGAAGESGLDDKEGAAEGIEEKVKVEGEEERVRDNDDSDVSDSDSDSSDDDDDEDEDGEEKVQGVWVDEDVELSEGEEDEEWGEEGVEQGQLDADVAPAAGSHVAAWDGMEVKRLGEREAEEGGRGGKGGVSAEGGSPRCIRSPSPIGAPLSPRGAQLSPRGAQPSPRGAQTSPRGAQPFPRGAQPSLQMGATAVGVEALTLADNDKKQVRMGGDGG
ncbi:unnamed protein product [Closterium sp. Yama58-4]|nr:unnamed protein product [Closterium sp. Yama58-4]